MNEVKSIKVKIFDNEAYPQGLQKIGGNRSDWIDLRARKDIVMKAGDLVYIPLGVAIELPEGYEALVAQGLQHLRIISFCKPIQSALLMSLSEVIMTSGVCQLMLLETPQLRKVKECVSSVSLNISQRLSLKLLTF